MSKSINVEINWVEAELELEIWDEVKLEIWDQFYVIREIKYFFPLLLSYW